MLTLLIAFIIFVAFLVFGIISVGKAMQVISKYRKNVEMDELSEIIDSE